MCLWCYSECISTPGKLKNQPDQGGKNHGRTSPPPPPPLVCVNTQIIAPCLQTLFLPCPFSTSVLKNPPAVLMVLYVGKSNFIFITRSLSLLLWDRGGGAGWSCLATLAVGAGTSPSSDDLFLPRKHGLIYKYCHKIRCIKAWSNEDESTWEVRSESLHESSLNSHASVKRGWE